MKEALTHREAYAAMYAYLEQVFDRTKSDDIGSLLGGMSLLPDGGTADPAAWNDWIDAIGKATAEGVDLDLRLK